VRRQRPLVEQLGGDLGIGGAAGIEQQARVIRLRRRLGVDSQAFTKPHREQRAVQAVLEGQPHAQVRGQTQRCNYFRGTDLFRARR
jgi:hypothetical protein